MTAAIVVVAAFAFTLLAGKPLIAALRSLQFQQHAYEDAPETHRQKTGTPTMGGLLFLAVALLALFVARDATSVALIELIAGCALIGIIDDLLSVAGGRNRGLRARTKFLATGLVAAWFLRTLSESGSFGSPDFLINAPGVHLFAPHWVWLVLCMAAIVASAHAVNLTDGLDGLAAGTLLPGLAVLAVVAWQVHLEGVTLAICALGGALLGFLYYNRFPARVFMGDTGSLALGGLLAGAAIVSGNVLLVPLIGGVFAVETLSVILQVAYYKRTKRRIFRMSPLHHHFELGGWPETKVTHRFWLASALCAALGLAIAR